MYCRQVFQTNITPIIAVLAQVCYWEKIIHQYHSAGWGGLESPVVEFDAFVLAHHYILFFVFQKFLFNRM